MSDQAHCSCTKHRQTAKGLRAVELTHCPGHSSVHTWESQGHSTQNWRHGKPDQGKRDEIGDTAPNVQPDRGARWPHR